MRRFWKDYLAPILVVVAFFGGAVAFGFVLGGLGR